LKTLISDKPAYVSPEFLSKFEKPFYMKSKEELKKELHKLIDGIEDEKVLNELNEDVVPYIIEARKLDTEGEDELTEEQMKVLNVAIAEADRGETVSFEEFKESMDKWRTELKSTKSSK
jgi:hypothetical protein